MGTPNSPRSPSQADILFGEVRIDMLNLTKEDLDQIYFRLQGIIKGQGKYLSLFRPIEAVLEGENPRDHFHLKNARVASFNDSLTEKGVTLKTCASLVVSKKVAEDEPEPGCVDFRTVEEFLLLTRRGLWIKGKTMFNNHFLNDSTGQINGGERWAHFIDLSHASEETVKSWMETHLYSFIQHFHHLLFTTVLEREKHLASMKQALATLEVCRKALRG